MKRIFAISLCTLMLFALLVSCGKQPEETPPENEPIEESAENAPVEKTEQTWVCRKSVWYDADGNLRTTYEYDYDRFGNRVYEKMSGPNMELLMGVDGEQVLYYNEGTKEYDELSHLLHQSHTSYAVEDDRVLMQTKVDSQYDEQGQLVRDDTKEIKRSGEEVATYTLYTYDELDRLESKKTFSVADDKLQSELKISYLAESEIHVTTTETGEVREMYTPNAESPVKKTIISRSGRSQDYETGTVHELGYDGTITYAYDAAGNCTEEVAEYTYYDIDGSMAFRAKDRFVKIYDEQTGRLKVEETYRTQGGEEYLSYRVEYTHDEYENWKTRVETSYNSKDSVGEVVYKADYTYEAINVTVLEKGER